MRLLRQIRHLVHRRGYFTGANVCFTAVQPSGVFHIGNFFGAVQPFLDLCDGDPKLKTIFSIADLHALTDFLPPEERQDHVLSLTAALLASGVNPRRTILFQQSGVAEHTLLAQLLTNFITLPHLQRMGQFKEKAARYKAAAVPLGILTYPVLQAADILLYRAGLVPVGMDQNQHVQIAQFMQKIFASKYSSNYLQYPELLPAARVIRISSLRDPYKKMSKSDVTDKSRIDITDHPEDVHKKIVKALTDFHSHLAYYPETRPAVANLLHLHSLVANKSIDEIVAELEGISMPEYKLVLAADVSAFWAPFSQEYYRLRDDTEFLVDVLQEGKKQAKVIAEETIDELSRIMGLAVTAEVRKIPAKQNVATLPRTKL